MKDYNGKNITCQIVAYDSLITEPKIKVISSLNILEFITKTTEETYQILQNSGSLLPKDVIKEAIENLIHADFLSPVISILPGANTIRISDRGTGIKDKEKCLLLGYTTATDETKKYIRGVGAGFSLIKENMKLLGGDIEIDDNLDGGTVISIFLEKETKENAYEKKYTLLEDEEEITLSDRQKNILLIISSLGTVGPSRIGSELNLSLCTSFRELNFLEKRGLLKNTPSGKRYLSQKGILYLQKLTE